MKIFFVDMIHNKQYPYYHIPAIKAQDGIKNPSHEYIHRMATPQTAGWFYEQKVIHQKRSSSFPVNPFHFYSNRIIVGHFINFLVIVIFA